MTNPQSEYQTIIEKFEKLGDRLDNLSEKVNLLNEKLELYKQVSDQKSESVRAEIKAYQDANKQQLNVSLGVLVTAAVAILVSVVISMN